MEPVRCRPLLPTGSCVWRFRIAAPLLDSIRQKPLWVCLNIRITQELDVGVARHQRTKRDGNPPSPTFTRSMAGCASYLGRISRMLIAVQAIYFFNPSPYVLIIPNIFEYHACGAAKLSLTFVTLNSPPESLLTPKNIDGFVML